MLAHANVGEYFGGAGGVAEGVNSPQSRETLAELWQNFLEQEAAAGSSSGASRGAKSRQGSTSLSHSSVPGVGGVPPLPTPKGS